MAISHPLVAPPSSQTRSTYRGWLSYGVAWLAAAGLWSLASATSARVSPLVALPYGLLIMGVAAAAGVGVWHLTGRLPWRARRGTFFTWHAIALVAYAFLYTVALVIPDIVRGDVIVAATSLKNSPVLWWSVLMGSWLYVMVAGVSYAIRSEQARDRDVAAAAEARLLAQQAQLTALRAQLNPHFLFNALHTVSALISHDPRGADRAIERLGDLLRYAMAEDELVPLSSEWSFVLDYLAFEKLRLGERLHVIEELAPEAEEILVPRLLLQPIVENAIRHGIAARAGEGTIRVEASIDGDALHVHVADDGLGERRESRRGGVGLTSVRRRLAAVFGDEADLRIEQGDSGGYVVRLTIPRSTP
jgi:LytS/YehU family sensor histidine kinase